MIRFSGLAYAFSSTASLSFPDWETASGQHALILGKSGSGKTTLLHLLGGLLSPSAGSILIDDTALHTMSGAKLDAYRGRHFGFVFQKPHLVAALSVLENLQLAAYLSQTKVTTQSMNQLLGSLGLKGVGHRKPFEISQGQAQRVSIARAVVHAPSIIFADEPTASLDDESCDQVLNLLLDQVKQHRATLIMATHDQRVKAAFSNQLLL